MKFDLQNREEFSSSFVVINRLPRKKRSWTLEALGVIIFVG